MQRSISIILCCLALSGLVACSSGDFSDAVQDTRVLMDTFGTITVYDRDKDREIVREAIEAAFAGMAEIEWLTSTYLDSSEISRINRGGGKLCLASPALVHCISEAQRVSALANGNFDITVGALTKLWGFVRDNPSVPNQDEISRALAAVDYRAIELGAGGIRLQRPGMALDLGGVAKGYAVDVAIDSLKARSITDAMVDTGSNLRTIVSELTAGKRRVWIRDPRDRSKLFARFRMDEGCVATSGDYERYFVQDSIRYHHILDPHTGWPARRCVSVTVIANSGMEADALSTAIFVMGPSDGLELVEQLDGVEAVILTEEDGEVQWRASTGLQGEIEIL